MRCWSGQRGSLGEPHAFLESMSNRMTNLAKNEINYGGLCPLTNWLQLCNE